MTLYSFAIQTKIVMTCFSIHIFIQEVSITDRLFYEYDNEAEMEVLLENPEISYYCHLVAI